jgi:hypothetical protein
MSFAGRFSNRSSQHLGIGSEVAVHGGWQFNWELDWPVIRDRGEFQLAATCSALIGREHEVAVDDHTNRDSWPDR